jgi:uncharacterized protein YdeI (YjbR/CyaY-like superfamily)
MGPADVDICRMTADPRIDRYIEQAAPFARPILTHLRATIRSACPDVEETIKWSRPSFGYHGKILCNISAFKQHAALSFWQGERVTQGAESADEHSAMGQFGRICSLDDLPDAATLNAMIVAAMDLIDSGEKAPRPIKHPRTPVEPPADLLAAIAAAPAARATFDAFPPSQQREYVDWVSEAKRPETRQRRIEQAIGMLAEGKRRNWKYENC